MGPTETRPIEEYPARTLKPVTAYPLIGDGPSRVIPGGALVTITENRAAVREDPQTAETAITATVYLDGDPYEAELSAEQFTRYPQDS